MKRIGILGSRNLSYKILQWIVGQDYVDIIGVVTPPFQGWWKDKLIHIAKDNKLQVFESIEELLEQKPDIVFSINYWKIISKEHIDLVEGGIVISIILICLNIEVDIQLVGQLLMLENYLTGNMEQHYIIYLLN